MDSALVCFWTLAIWLFLTSGQQPTRYFGCCVAVGLCGMTKHLGLVVEILLLLAVIGAMCGIWRRLGARRTVLGLLLILLISLPWHLWQWYLHGARFIDVYIGTEIYQRAFGHHPAAPGLNYFLFVVKDGLYPWSLLLPFVLLSWLRRGPWARRQRECPLLIWILLIGVVTLTSDVKLPWYVLPAYPALAVLIANFVRQAFTADHTGLTTTGLLAVAAVAALSVSTAGKLNLFAVPAQQGMVTVDLFAHLRIPGGGPSPVGIAVILATLAVAGIWLLQRRYSRTCRDSAWLNAGLLFGLAAAALFYAVLPLRHAATRSALDRLVSEAAASGLIQGEATVALDHIRWRPYITDYYLRRLPDGHSQFERKTLLAALRAGELHGPILLSRGDYEHVARDSPSLRTRVEKTGLLECEDLVLIPSKTSTVRLQ
jgi:4-amino-4-deoxy-L-arabinose transferase-like glycosyltransferase